MEADGESGETRTIEVGFLVYYFCGELTRYFCAKIMIIRGGAGAGVLHLTFGAGWERAEKRDLLLAAHLTLLTSERV